MVDKRYVDHPVGRMSGVTESDTRIQAAEKAYQTMVDAGFGEKDLQKARDMIERAKARGIK